MKYLASLSELVSWVLSEKPKKDNKRRYIRNTAIIVFNPFLVRATTVTDGRYSCAWHPKIIIIITYIVFNRRRRIRLQNDPEICLAHYYHSLRTRLQSSSTNTTYYRRRRAFSSRALDKVSLLDDRRPLDLLRLHRGQRRLMMVMRRWSQVRVHVFVDYVVVRVALVDDDARFADEHLMHLVPVVGPLFHRHTAAAAVRVPVVVVRLIIGTGPVVGHVVLDARVRWPARRGLPVGPIDRTEKKNENV